MYRFKKKKAPRSKNIHPNVSAYNSTGPKKRNRGQKQLIWLSQKKSPGPAQTHAGPKKISPQGPENTQASSQMSIILDSGFS